MKPVLITSSILILLLAALRPILRGKIDPRLQYALWLIVALRLLVPVELATSAYSALALLDRAEGPAQVAQTIGRTTVPIPAMSYEEAFDQALSELQQEQTITTSFTDLDQVDSRAQELLEQGPTLAQLFEKYARPVWLGGAALAGLWFLLVNLRFRRRLRAAELAVMDPSTRLPVYVSDALLSPCLCGAFRPAIYITPHAVQDPDRLRHVLAHESTHYRHRDHWWALVRCLCLCLYWFDPLVWWAAALSRQDCELACDAGAIRRLGEEERIPYGRTLVDMIAAGRCSLMQTATTMTGGKRRVRQRVRLIARRPKTVIAVALALALVLGAAVGCTFTGAPENPAPTLDNLQERLMDLPQDLQADVTALSGSEPTATLNSDFTALAQYWMNRDWTDYDGIGMGWLMTVYQWDQEQFEQYYPDLEVTGGVDCFAKDDSFYYIIFRATDARAPMSETGYMDAFEAIRAYAMEQVLATQGVEPYAPGQSADTLQERLESIPEELRGEVTLFHPDAPQTDKSDILATYLLDNTDPEWGNRLLTVRQLDHEGFENWLNGTAGYTQIFARDSEYYYALSYPSDVQYRDEDASRYVAASKAIGDYAMKTVLETDGVEPYSPDENRQPLDTLQARLMDVPEEWRDKVSAPDDIQEPSVLVYYWLDDPKWQDLSSGWLLTLYRLDGDLVQHDLDQQLWPSTGIDIFARSGDQYYVILWPGDGRYQDSSEFWDAAHAMQDHVKATVLATEGVEPFDPYTTPPHFFSNVPVPPLDPGSYAIDGMDYTLVTSYAQLPEDPEQWYLAGYLPYCPVWMFTRGYGQETMFQVEDRLTQVFPYTACFFGGGNTHDGHAPQLMPLDGFGSGPNGTFGPVAVITHIFQGGTDQMYQLTVYDLGTDAVTPYVHDWEALMNDFNQTAAVQFDPIERAAHLSYGGHRAELKFDEEQWDVIQQNHSRPQVYDTDFSYSFDHDGTANLDMAVWTDPSFAPSYTARWTIRFTGDGFETTNFRFVQSVYP